jgi:hypothetical protein
MMVPRLLLSIAAAVAAAVLLRVVLAAAWHVVPAWNVTSPQIAVGMIALGIMLGRCVPLFEALVAGLVAACVSATLGPWINDVLQRFPTGHVSLVSEHVSWVASALALDVGWGITLGGAFRRSSPAVRIGLAAAALAVSIGWTAVVFLNPWYVGYAWPAATRVVVYAAMGYALGRAGVRSGDAVIAVAGVVVVAEAATAVLSILSQGETFARFEITPMLPAVVLSAAAVLGACAYALGRRGQLGSAR